MAGLIDSIVQKYNYYLHDLADPRTKDWLGVSNPMIVLSIVSAYLYFCKSLGPRLMQNRPPFELKTPIMLYNLFQVCFSIFLVHELYNSLFSTRPPILYIFVLSTIVNDFYITKLGDEQVNLMGAVYIFNKEYDITCDPVDYSYKPRALRIAAAAWFYFAAKITELMDTIFFVLRKKYNQVSFLHVYHHTLMSLVIWYGVKYCPGGHIVLMGFLNSIVHVIMYTYYLISGFGPEYQKYVWWKKHVTMIQLIQFAIVFVHNFAVFFYKCDYPKILNTLSCLNALAFLYMFGKFYLKSYQKSPKSKGRLETLKGPSLTTEVNNLNIRRKVAEKTR